MMADPLLPRELQVLCAAALIALLAWVVYLIRYHRLTVRDSLLWLASTSGALLVTLFPSVLRAGAAAAGVEVPANALFAVAILYGLVNLLSLTVATSSTASRARRLTQECALLRAEVDLLRERLDRTEGQRRAP